MARRFYIYGVFVVASFFLPCLPPLCVPGLSGAVNGGTALLHDGRARNVTEAILWHCGGEQRTREAFINMPKAHRRALAYFTELI